MISGLGKAQREDNSSSITEKLNSPYNKAFSLNPKTPLEFASLLTIA